MVSQSGDLSYDVFVEKYCLAIRKSWPFLTLSNDLIRQLKSYFPILRKRNILTDSFFSDILLINHI
jgi:hypothetical protein